MSHFSFETWFYHLVRTQFPARDAEEVVQDSLASLRAEFIADGLDPDAMAARARLLLMNRSDAVATGPGADKQEPGEGTESLVASVSASTLAHAPKRVSAADVANDIISKSKDESRAGMEVLLAANTEETPISNVVEDRSTASSTHPQPAGELQTPGGPIELRDDGLMVYAKFRDGVIPRVLRLVGSNKGSYDLVRSVRWPSLFEVPELTLREAADFVSAHSASPGKCPVSWE